MKRNSEGITLIALVITIIVLLILAGVTINLTLGENGLFRIAKKSVENYTEKEEQEQQGLNKLLSEMNNYIDEKLQLEIVGGTLGEKNWYKSEVEIKIVNINENEITKYALTGATTKEEEEIKSGATIKIVNDGTTIITVKSYDVNGTQTYETKKEIHKDSQAPTIENEQEKKVAIGTDINEEYIKTNSEIKDNLTEVKIVDLTVKNSANKIIGEGEQVKKLDDYDIYSVSFKIKDEAGNSQEIEQKITTTPTTNITLKNIIPDSGFETGVSGWYNENTIESATDKKMSGQSSLKYTVSNEQAFARKNYGDLGIAGKNTYCSIYVMSEEQTTWPDFGVLSANTAGEWPDDGASVDGHVSSLGEAYNKWIKLSCILTKEKAQYDNLLITLAQNDVNGTGALWWDNMMVIDLSPFGDKVPTIAWLDSMIQYIDSDKLIL